MKKTMLKLSLLALIVMFMGCSHKTTVKTPEVNVTTIVNPSDGLDLKLVGALLQDGKVKDAAGLEKELNKDGGINNLDLDGNKQVDYINVSENNSDGHSGVKSFDLTTGGGENVTHIASIEIEKGTSDEYNINMSGSETVYGSGHHYHSSYHSTGGMLFYAWLFSPRPYYHHTPYYYGHYPSYYGGSRIVVSRTQYTTRTSTQRTTANRSVTKSKTPTSKVKSTNKGKTSKAARTSINNNKKSQKQMKARSTSKPVNKGGFTNKSSPSSSKSKGSSYSRPKSSPSKSRSYSKPKSSPSRSVSRSGGRRSDENYKQDISPIDNALETIMGLYGVTYYWKPINNYEDVIGANYTNTRQIGFIAQDVEVIVPEVVGEDVYGKTVEYDLIVPLLVEAIKEQQEQINDLREELNSKNK